MTRAKYVALVAFALFASCKEHDEPPPPVDAGPPQWRVVLDHLDGTLLSVWGSSERDVWTVGGPLGNTPYESLVLRFDGTTWKRIEVGGTETFWWVSGTSANDVWLVGEKGRIAHFDGTTFRETPSGTTATLFGVWASSASNAWAVGGAPDGTGPKDVVLHWDGMSWKSETLPSASNVALFKVWGLDENDVYVVGDAGVVWHRTNGTWAREAVGLAKGRITTVSGCGPNRIFAVGGRDILASNGRSWTRVADVLLVNDVNGVACAPTGALPHDFGDAVIVGGGSLKLRLVGGAFVNDFGTEPFTDLHGAWVDPGGSFWAVGGNFNGAPQPNVSRNGVIAHFGRSVVPSTVDGAP